MVEQREQVEPKPRGRAALPLRTGLFIRDWLEKVGEDSISGIHSAYKSRMWTEVNVFRAKEEQIRPCTYESFVKYFGHLRRLGLVEFVREEPTEWVAHGKLMSIRMAGPWPDARPLPPTQVVPSTRRIYRLSERGRSEEMAELWGDPLVRKLFRRVLVG